MYSLGRGFTLNQAGKNLNHSASITQEFYYVVHVRQLVAEYES